VCYYNFYIPDGGVGVGGVGVGGVGVGGSGDHGWYY